MRKTCSLGNSRSGGEVLQTDQHDLNYELQVYPRKRFHMRSKDLNVNPTQAQFEKLSSGTEISCNQIPTPTLISSIVSNDSPIIPNLDVPIVIRKDF